MHRGTREQTQKRLEYFRIFPNFSPTVIAPVFHVWSSTADHRSSEAVVCKRVPVPIRFNIKLSTCMTYEKT